MSSDCLRSSFAALAESDEEQMQPLTDSEEEEVTPRKELSQDSEREMDLGRE